MINWTTFIFLCWSSQKKRNTVLSTAMCKSRPNMTSMWPGVPQCPSSREATLWRPLRCKTVFTTFRSHNGGLPQGRPPSMEAYFKGGLPHARPPSIWRPSCRRTVLQLLQATSLIAGVCRAQFLPRIDFYKTAVTQRSCSRCDQSFRSNINHALHRGRPSSMEASLKGDLPQWRPSSSEASLNGGLLVAERFHNFYKPQVWLLVAEPWIGTWGS